MNYSVLMSVYAKEKPEYLRISIESMLHQTCPPDEFIIVKDGPLTDELDKVIDDFAINNSIFKVVELEKNQGLGLALAYGLQLSKNELIARMDSDDFSVPNRCEKQISLFERDSELEIVGSYEAEFIGTIDNVVSIHKVPEKNEEIAKAMRRRCSVLHPTVMFKKSAVLKCGNYHDVKLYEDYDLFVRMILENKSKSYNIQDCLYYIRTSEDFYKRRGGLKYAKTVLKFKWGMFRKKYMSLIDFVISGLGQAFVCVMPNFFRKWFYKTFLR